MASLGDKVSTDVPEAFGLDATQSEVPARRWQEGAGAELVSEVLAEELPLAILLNGDPYAVMLGSPRDLNDFAVGFCLTEGLVESADDVTDFAVVTQPEGVELRLTLTTEHRSLEPPRERLMPGRTGCGLCGVRALASAVRFPARLATQVRVTDAGIQAALGALSARQRLYAETGAVHAAAWADITGRLLLVREDVGRHNALDKLIGAMARNGIAPASGFALVSSRSSYEMVQKAATAGIEVLVAVSAPTALARRIAESSGLTLIAFARSGRHTVYAHPERLESELVGFQ